MVVFLLKVMTTYVDWGVKQVLLRYRTAFPVRSNNSKGLDLTLLVPGDVSVTSSGGRIEGSSSFESKIYYISSSDSNSFQLKSTKVILCLLFVGIAMSLAQVIYVGNSMMLMHVKKVVFEFSRMR